MFEVTDLHENDFVEVELKTGESIAGVLFHLDGDFVKIKEYVDYNFFGFKLILKDFVSEIRVAQPRSILRSIVKRESLDLVSDGFSFLFRITKWEQLIGELFDRGLISVFHIDEESMHIGRLISKQIDNIEMICIDSGFSYDEKPIELQIHSVSMIELGSEYIRIYSKYSS